MTPNATHEAPQPTVRHNRTVQALEETLDILSDPHAREELAEAREALAVGDFVDGIEAVWRLRPRS